ncbi:MAG TPA: gamma-glutamyl-gamma-aminobutyrate hydrolase family protein [Gemmatales bacterium]|nr:gamma-glutamyl-gamma-aminobutyrate hydrolase family protein [Gemmatales bacterium]HMP58015.1 gamma-glutamyl-gamma-aminobutyrate hydrolase family protein [Gemmatales bacterium]
MSRTTSKVTPSRPVIGINADFVPAGKTSSAQMRVHAGYADSVFAAGGLPLVIPTSLKERELEETLDKLDGFLLTGGPLDLDPKRLGMPPSPHVQPMPARREDFDRMLCRLIVQRKMPCLAVALGALELNIICGGSIFLHLPTDIPKSFPHKDLNGGVHRHAVMLEPGTRLDHIYGGGEIRVNSYHQQAVNQLAPCFRVAAKSIDGVVEAFETVDPHWNCTGVQWHPHSETASALDMQLFEAFVQSCTRHDLRVFQAAA